MVNPVLVTYAVQIIFYVSLALAGAAVGAVAATQISAIRLRSKFDSVIARQRARCRPLFDFAGEELTFDDSLQHMAVQVIERVREEIAPL